MKKKLTLVLVLALALSLLCLSGCGEKEADKFIGSWEGTIDAAEGFNEGLMESPAGEFLTVDELPISFILNFYDNGTYDVKLDMDSAVEAMFAWRAEFTANAGPYLEELMKLTYDIEMSADDILAASGMTMEEFVNSAFTDELLTDTATQMGDGINGSGNFEAKDGMLFLSDGVEYNVDESIYENYSITDTQLTFVSPSAEETQLWINYPVVFDRVG